MADAQFGPAPDNDEHPGLISAILTRLPLALSPKHLKLSCCLAIFSQVIGLPGGASARPAEAVTLKACGADPSGRSDSTSAFETCLNGLPAGDLVIPYGTYRLTRPIIKTRNQNLVGMGSKASILKCDNPDGPCIVAADTSGGPNNYSISDIRNLGIEGPGGANRGVGILIGGDPKGKWITAKAFGDSVNLTDLRITGFNHGVEWGNNAWANKLLHCAIFQNSVGLFADRGLGNSGEAISITDSNIFNNGQSGIDDHANFEWMIQGTSFDYNTTAISFYGSTIHAINCHFEQPTARVFFQPYGDATLSIKDSEILVQNNTGTDKYILDVWPQTLLLSIDDVSIWSNHPVQFFLHVQGNIVGSINMLHGNGNHKIAALSEKLSRCPATNIYAF